MSNLEWLGMKSRNGLYVINTRFIHSAMTEGDCVCFYRGSSIGWIGLERLSTEEAMQDCQSHFDGVMQKEPLVWNDNGMDVWTDYFNIENTMGEFVLKKNDEPVSFHDTVEEAKAAAEEVK